MSERPSLLPPSDGSYLSATPSGLTPNTRTEAEAALTLNSITQTDSAAPDPTLLAQDGTSEAHKAYRRPGVARTSSTNYENALKRAQEASVDSTMSTETVSDNITGETVASPTASTTPFPPPGQGVVPLNYGAAATRSGDLIKKTRSRGLSLSGLAQQQGWSEQDFKHVYSSELLEEPKANAGYGSGSGPKP